MIATVGLSVDYTVPWQRKKTPNHHGDRLASPLCPAFQVPVTERWHRSWIKNCLFLIKIFCKTDWLTHLFLHVTDRNLLHSFEIWDMTWLSKKITWQVIWVKSDFFLFPRYYNGLTSNLISKGSFFVRVPFNPGTSGWGIAIVWSDILYYMHWYMKDPSLSLSIYKYIYIHI